MVDYFFTREDGKYESTGEIKFQNKLKNKDFYQCENKYVSRTNISRNSYQIMNYYDVTNHFM